MKRFESFQLDSVNHCLWRGDTRVSITPKAFDMLRYLVEHPGRLVTQDEILNALWPKAYVNQEVIKKYILSIRKALGDDPNEPVFIETVPRRGYQFIAPVTDDATHAPDSPPRAAHIVGRESASAQLDRHLANALRGMRQVVFVTGEAGIGKTAFVDAFHRRCLGTAPAHVARGHCVEGFGGREPYYPVLEALTQLTRNDRGSPVTQLLIKRAPAWLVQFPALTTQESRSSLQDEILGATRDRMVREMCEMLEAWTAANPLVLILEDLHWVDSSTLDLVSALARRREAAKLLLLCTCRPDEGPAAQGGVHALKLDLLLHELCQEVVLQNLNEDDVAAYLRQAFPIWAAPDEFARLVVRHTGGNALFVREVTRELVQDGVLADHDGRWNLTRPIEQLSLGVPATLKQMLDLQFQRLARAEQQVLRSASVQGEQFSIRELGATVDAPVDQVEDACEALAARGEFIRYAGLEQIGGAALSARYEFRHALYRQAVYRSLSEINRVRLHRTVGNRLKEICAASKLDLAAEVAMHLQEGGEYEDAARHLVLAAANAAQRFAYRDAIRILQEALELLGRVEPGRSVELQLQIHEQIGDTHYWLGEMAASRRAYESEAALAATFGLASAQVDALSRQLMPLGFIDPDEGIAIAEQAAKLTENLRDASLRPIARMQAAGYRCVYDRWTEADWQTWTAESERVALSVAGLPPYLRSLNHYLLLLRGAHNEVLGLLESEPATATHQTWNLMLNLFTTSARTVALLRAGRFGELLQLVRTGQEIAARNGTDPWLFVLREAWLRTVVLDFDGALAVCEPALSTTRTYPTSQLATIARVARGYSEIAKGNYVAANESFAEVCDPRSTRKFFLHWLWRLIARQGLSESALRSGKLVEARHHADVFLESALSSADPHLHALAWELQARVAFAERNFPAARVALHEALGVLEKHDIPTVAWRIHATAWQQLQATDSDSSETARAQRERAATCVARLAESLPTDEPLRNIFLAAAPVRRILEDTIESASFAPGKKR